MMTNLFSIFDPSSSILKLNWMIQISLSILIFPFIMKKSKTLNLTKKIIFSIKKETSPILSHKNFKMTELILISLFISIMMLNLLSMAPFNFTLNAHIMLTFPVAFLWWLTMMIFGWSMKSKTMIFHIIPTGTPTILINFMMLIELISNFIRPLTLAIRLSANMIAGHLLMNLLGSIKPSLMFLPITSMSMVVLTVLELAVSVIQAYVFMMLLALYSTEMN